MTTLTFIVGIVLVTYSIISAFCPTVDKKDSAEAKYIPIETEEKPVMISKIIKIEPADDQHKILVDDVQGEIITNMYTYYDVPLSYEIQQYITDQCLEKFGTLELCGYNLPKLVINIIRWESGFDAENDNGKCCGLMSVTHKLSDAIKEEERITNLIEPAQNIRAGIRILKNMYDYAYNLFTDHGWFPDYISDKALIDVSLNVYRNGYYSIDFKSDYVNNILSTYETTKERS